MGLDFSLKLLSKTQSVDKLKSVNVQFIVKLIINLRRKNNIRRVILLYQLRIVKIEPEILLKINIKIRTILGQLFVHFQHQKFILNIFLFNLNFLYIFTLVLFQSLNLFPYNSLLFNFVSNFDLLSNIRNYNPCFVTNFFLFNFLLNHFANINQLQIQPFNTSIQNQFSILFLIILLNNKPISLGSLSLPLKLQISLLKVSNFFNFF